MASLLIVNPAASKVDERLTAGVLAALPGEVELRRTQASGDATELAREAHGWAEAIYVFSGDGGFNEALNGSDGTVPLGFIPGGGTSVLPRALGLPREPVAAARRIAEGRRRRISVGRVNGRRFGFSAGIGLDAELLRQLDARGRDSTGRRPGDRVFAAIAVRTLAARRGRFEPILEIDGLGRAAFVLVGNADPYTYAGKIPLRATPRASFEGGLDLVAPRGVRPLAWPRLAGYLVSGRGHERARDLLTGHDLDRIEIRCDEPTPLQADGEDLGDVVSVVLEAERDAVTVLV
jgi:diacylglycerol kinase family enzyme